ncbi:MAG: hypothetical protein WD533_05535, partial [Dehalococcoidia bacterium]
MRLKNKKTYVCGVENMAVMRWRGKMCGKIRHIWSLFGSVCGWGGMWPWMSPSRVTIRVKQGAKQGENGAKQGENGAKQGEAGERRA